LFPSLSHVESSIKEKANPGGAEAGDPDSASKIEALSAQ
jgi:hypothetical protein